MNTPFILTVVLASLSLLQCAPAHEPMSLEQRGYHKKALTRLASIQRDAVAVELYVDPFSMASEAYKKSPRAKHKGELAEQGVARWRRAELTPEQAATLLGAVKEAELRYSGSPNMHSQPAYALTLAFRDAQGKLLGTIDPFDFFPKAPELRDFFRFYQLDEPRVKELRLIIYKAVDATNLLRKKITPSSEPCPDCGEVHQVI